MITRLLCWLLIRQQIARGDKQFLEPISRITLAQPHVQKTSIQDSQLQALCRRITSSQQAEIAKMKTLLGELKK